MNDDEQGIQRWAELCAYEYARYRDAMSAAGLVPVSKEVVMEEAHWEIFDVPALLLRKRLMLEGAR